MRSNVVRRGLSVVAIGAVALLAACSSTSTQVSDEIAAQVKDKLDLSTEPGVTCPDDAEAGEGETFTCTLDLDDGTVPVKVTFKDDTNFTTEVDGAVYKKAVLDEALTEKLAEGGVTVKSFDCEGGSLLVFKTDTTVACTVTGTGGGTADVTVGLDDDNNAVMTETIYLKESLDAAIPDQLAADYGEVAVTCGEDEVIAVAEDTTIECEGTDSTGATATITVALGLDGTAQATEVTPN